MVLQSYTLVEGYSYIVFYDTIVEVKSQRIPVHYLLYINGNPRELRSLFLKYKDRFRLPIVYVMDNPKIFGKHSVVIDDVKGKKLYMFNGRI